MISKHVKDFKVLSKIDERCYIVISKDKEAYGWTPGRAWLNYNISLEMGPNMESYKKVF